ncbi:unnamed protein product, partial [Vitis vinifera]|uniref:Uncharacterized protein n=1 Tax=Vitis vinifera TaxID=29760 RepID=D7T3T3_VITVI
MLQGQSLVVLVSNRFYFSFIVHPESKATTNGFGLQNVVPATEEEACHILKRMDAESLLREKVKRGTCFKFFLLELYETLRNVEKYYLLWYIFYACWRGFLYFYFYQIL